jgi:hypothetical protein
MKGLALQTSEIDVLSTIQPGPVTTAELQDQPGSNTA